MTGFTSVPFVYFLELHISSTFWIETTVSGSATLFLWFTSKWVKPACSSSVVLQPIQQSEIILNPGSMLSLICWSKVSAPRVGTSTKNLSPVSRHTHRCSKIHAALFFLFVNKDSSISTIWLILRIFHHIDLRSTLSVKTAEVRPLPHSRNKLKSGC